MGRPVFGAFTSSPLSAILALASSQKASVTLRRPRIGASIGIKWPGAALARNISQYPRARSFWYTTDGHSIVPALGGGTRVARLRLPGLPAAIFAAVGFGFLPRCAIMLLAQGHTALFCDSGEGLSASLERGRFAGERLPAAHSDVDV